MARPPVAPDALLAWRLFASAFMKHLTRPPLIAFVILAALASFARGKPLLRLRRMTELFRDRAMHSRLQHRLRRLRRWSRRARFG